MFAIKTLVCISLLTLCGISSADASSKAPVISSKTHAKLHFGSSLPPHAPTFSACRYLKTVSRIADAAATIGWVATKAAAASGVEQVATVVGVATAGATAIAAPTQIVVWVMC